MSEETIGTEDVSSVESVLEEKNDAHIEKRTATITCDPCGVETSFDYPADTPPGTEIKWEHGQSDEDDALCNRSLFAEDGSIIEDKDGQAKAAKPFVGIFTVPENN
jgi:hypothetical protein